MAESKTKSKAQTEPQQKQPGREARMQPPPQAEATDYKPAGKLTGCVALISGGDSGIGKSVAIHFAKEGADVAIIYLDEDEDAARTRELVEREGRDCLVIAGDVGDRQFCRKAVSRVLDRFGKIHILVNNAGEQHMAKDFAKIDREQWERTFQTNIFGIFQLTQECLPHLEKSGAIVNTASVTAFKGNPALVDYSATKGAIVAFTRSLALQLADKGVRVNAVAPGPIWTPLIVSTFPEDKLEKFGKDTPLGRPGQPDEVAPCYVFLASKDASYISGQVLHPNGGEIVA